MPEIVQTMRILHITPWFPEQDDPYHGIFIERHVQSLHRPEIENTVVHLAVHLPGTNRRSHIEKNTHHIHYTLPFKSWRLAEWVYIRMLRKKLIELHAKENYTHVCFHIAYPALMGYARIASLLPQKKLIIEHWSAYHFNFHSNKIPHRLRSLFNHHIRLVTVSKKLGDDIAAFCGTKISYTVLPNVVDTSCFHFASSHGESTGNQNKINLLMHAFWKEPKQPMEVLKEFTNEPASDFILTITGYGPLWEKMMAYAVEHKINHRVIFVENASPQKIAELMQLADAFVLPTSYETFSVVTAEALCCGCPVIVSETGALPELVTDENGILKSKNESWLDAFNRFRNRSFDRKNISESAAEKFSARSVGDQFINILNSL
jgi:glycosyltransferase involved in cell wall biosynthesis